MCAWAHLHYGRRRNGRINNRSNSLCQQNNVVENDVISNPAHPCVIPWFWMRSDGGIYIPLQSFWERHSAASIAVQCRYSEHTKYTLATIHSTATATAEMEDYKFLFKVVLVGNAGVGKTCLVRRFTQGLFPPGQGATIGVDFMIKTVEVDGEKIKVIFDVNISICLSELCLTFVLHIYTKYSYKSGTRLARSASDRLRRATTVRRMPWFWSTTSVVSRRSTVCPIGCVRFKSTQMQRCWKFSSVSQNRLIFWEACGMFGMMPSCSHRWLNLFI